MGRTPIHMSVIISSTQDSRFVKPKTFHSIPAVSKTTGISLRAVRNAYHSKRTSIRKVSGNIYTLEWQEPFQGSIYDFLFGGGEVNPEKNF